MKNNSSLKKTNYRRFRLISYKRSLTCNIIFIMIFGVSFLSCFKDERTNPDDPQNWSPGTDEWVMVQLAVHGLSFTFTIGSRNRDVVALFLTDL